MYSFKVLMTVLLAANVKAEWEIKQVLKVNVGECRDCLSTVDAEQSNYDFAIYGDRYFLTDYYKRQVKIYDKSYSNIANVELDGQPEVITVLGNKLFVLVRNNSIYAYDIESCVGLSRRIDDSISSFEYLSAFYFDSLLVLSKSNTVYTSRSTERLVRFIDTISIEIKSGYIDFMKKLKLQNDAGISFRPPNVMDFCGGNRNLMVYERYSSSRSFQSDGFLMITTSEPSIQLLPGIPDSLGMLLHNNVGRGMKCVGGKIYFISELFKQKEHSIIVGCFDRKRDKNIE